MPDIVILEWTYSPPDFFEKSFHVTREDYKMIIDNGKVEARIDPNIFEKRDNMRDDLHEELNNRFLGVQLLVHKPYELSRSSMYRLHPDGRKDVTVYAETCVMEMRTFPVDVNITDKDGNVISDTRKERIEKKMELADLAEKFGSKDKLAESLLRSNMAAVNDPDNELVHLYEIREALAVRFGGKSTAITELGVSGAQWDRLGQLSNNTSVKQGRHRINYSGGLQDATESELNEVRSVALSLVEGYLKYLDKEG